MAKGGVFMSAEIVPFDYHGRSVRTVTIGGEAWFVAVDVCAVLGLGNTTDALKGIQRDRLAFSDVIDSIGRKHRVKVISESGLYRLILRSNKSEAERFQDWICDDVLPQIRRTGKFQIAVPFLVPEAQPWTKTFDDDFLRQHLSLERAARRSIKECAARVTNDIIYRRLPEGVFQALQVSNPVLPGRKHRAKKQHQFVEPTIARRHLDRLLNRCTGMMIGFASWTNSTILEYHVPDQARFTGTVRIQIRGSTRVVSFHVRSATRKI